MVHAPLSFVASSITATDMWALLQKNHVAGPLFSEEVRSRTCPAHEAMAHELLLLHQGLDSAPVALLSASNFHLFN